MYINGLFMDVSCSEYGVEGYSNNEKLIEEWKEAVVT
jgi:hypothetical protein